MKKKILSFISCLCIIASCMFMIIACGDPPPTDDPAEWKTVTNPTCTQEGLKKRTVNGIEETEIIPALGHSYGEWATTLNETCTTNGSKQRTCGRCSNIETETIPAHHTLDGTIKYDENWHWEHCTECTEKVNAQSHTLISIKNDNYLAFDAIKYIGYSQKDTCEHCDVQIKATQKITSSNGTSNLKKLYSDMVFIVKNCAVEFKNNFKYSRDDSSGDTFLSNSHLYDITYNTADNSVTYVCNEEPDPILSTNPLYIGFKLVFNSNDEPQSIYRMKNDGVLETDPIINFEKETSADYVTYKLMASTGLCYRTIKVDNNGNVLQLITYAYSDSTLLSEYIYSYTYDEYGFIIKYESNTSSNPVYEFKNCTYDENGNRVGFEYYTNGNLQYTVSSTFNEENQITQIKYDYSNPYYNYDYIALEYTYQSNKLSHIKHIYAMNSDEQDIVYDYDCAYTDSSFTITNTDNSEEYFSLNWESTFMVN